MLRHSHSIPRARHLSLHHLHRLFLVAISSPRRALVKGKAGERDSRGLYPPARAIMSISNTTNCTQLRFCTGVPTATATYGTFVLSPTCTRGLLNSPRASKIVLSFPPDPVVHDAPRSTSLSYNFQVPSRITARRAGGIGRAVCPRTTTGATSTTTSTCAYVCTACPRVTTNASP